MDKLSVIIPAYIDTEAVEEKCVKLLEDLGKQRQKYPQTEIIVIDDDSPETSYRYLAGTRLICFNRHEPGVSGARNTGLEVATGNLIAFCDADDGVEPDYLRAIYETFREHPNARAAVFGSSVLHNQNLAHQLPNLAVWSYAFRRDAIGNERFDENKQAGEDYDWLGRIWKGDGLLAVPKRIYRYDWDVNPNSLSKRYNRGGFQK